MSFFSRLSDIIGCNISDLMRNAPDPVAAIAAIISEMEQGLTGARRSVNSATNTEQRLSAEISDLESQAAQWQARARDSLLASNEAEARRALARKKEIEDLLAGLRQQHAAALATLEQLRTTLRAIEARIADARRKQSQLASPAEVPDPAAAAHVSDSSDNVHESPARSRDEHVELELEKLRQELFGG